MTRILLTHTPAMRAAYYGERALAALRQHGEVVLNPSDDVLDSPAALAQAAAGARIIVADRQTPGPAALFPLLPELVAFCRVAVDISTIDVAAASAHGVLVTRATPGFVPAVAELAVGLMVDLARGVSEAANAFRAGRRAEARMGRQLAGSTLGVIGFGAIGRRLAELGVALGMDVLVNDPHAGVPAPYREAALDGLLAEADFVVCLAASNAETAGLMSAAQFRAMRPSAYFINLSRGQLVDEAALARALDEGWIAGAAIDVGMAPDQMPSPALATHPKVVATPHIGGLTPQAIEHQAFDTVRQVADIAAGRVPAGAVNADVPLRMLRP